MIKDLVSLLTPAYNSGNFIHRLLDSVLEQDYPQIEMVVVDDGSADNTRQKVESYIPKFAQRGYSLKYLYKENGGQASAINMGLPLLQGEFIAWPDSDDYYTFPHSISTFVRSLKENGERVGLVRSSIRRVSEEGLEPIDGSKTPPIGNPFYEIIEGGHFLMIPIAYMVKAKAIDSTIPHRQIYHGYHSQNIQMFEPLVYSFKLADTSPELSTYVERNNSMSHKKRSCEQLLVRYQGWLDNHVHTLDSMSALTPEERMYYKKKVANQLLKEMLDICFHYSNTKGATSVIKEMQYYGLDISKRNLTVLSALV